MIGSLGLTAPLHPRLDESAEELLTGLTLHSSAVLLEPIRHAALESPLALLVGLGLRLKPGKSTGAVLAHSRGWADSKMPQETLLRGPTAPEGCSSQGTDGCELVIAKTLTLPDST